MKHARRPAVLVLTAGIALTGCTATYTVGSAQHGSTSPGAAPASPVRTPASPVRTPAGPSPTKASAQPASWAWCSSAPDGQSGTLAGKFDLFNNEWNTAYHPGPQMICGNSPSHWQVTSTQRAGNTAILAFPCVQVNYNGTKGYPLSSFTSMTSSYAENMHVARGTDAQASWDILLKNPHEEVMVWVDNARQTPGGVPVAIRKFSGATWHLYETHRGYMAFIRQGNATSGTVDLLAALKYLERRGDLSASNVLWQVSFGWEIGSTGGKPETFTVSSYSLSSAPSS